ncbi:MAG: hypothetical protein C4534_11285, partial [Gaiellales bacterium]
MGPFLGGFLGFIAALLLLVLVPLFRIESVVRWSDSLGSWFARQLAASEGDGSRARRWVFRPLLLVLLQVEEWTDGLENRYFRAAIRIFLYVNIVFAAIWVALFVLLLLAVIALALLILALLGRKGSG